MFVAGYSMRSLLQAVVLIGGALYFTTQAQAAVVEVIQDKVSVNAGHSYVRVAGSVNVRPGASVMAAPGGSADIIYENGCRQRVEPGSIAVVQHDPRCDFGSIPSDHEVLGGLLVVGGIVGGVIAIHSSRDHAASGE